MSNTELQAKSWVCSNRPTCVYVQDTDPFNPWQQSPDMFPDVPLGKCPSCYSNKGDFDLVELSAESPVSFSVISDTDLEATQVQALDANGQPLMMQVGEHYELHVDRSNGQISSILVPDYAPQMRSLTATEISNFKLQRDKNVDSLSSAVVSETTP